MCETCETFCDIQSLISLYVLLMPELPHCRDIEKYFHCADILKALVSSLSVGTLLLGKL